MTAYYRIPSILGDIVTEEFVNEPCTVCGVRRLECAETLGEPYVKVEEED